MPLFSRLFGKGVDAGSSVEPEAHGEYRIYPEPKREAGGYRLCARIEKEISGKVVCHQLIRADVFSGKDEAAAASLAKARQVIDEQGDGIFG